MFLHKHLNINIHGIAYLWMGNQKLGKLAICDHYMTLKWLQKLVCILQMLKIKIIPNNDAINALQFKKTQGF